MINDKKEQQELTTYDSDYEVDKIIKQIKIFYKKLSVKDILIIILILLMFVMYNFYMKDIDKCNTYYQILLKNVTFL